MTFILLDIITVAVLAFTIGLYTGAFVQRRRDNVRFKLAQTMIGYLLDEIEKIKRVEDKES